ncbi:MAG: hypothetical protein WD426_03970 [Anditalea sp.]
MGEKKEMSLHLPHDLLVPKGDALLITLKEHIKSGGKVTIHIQGQEEKTVTTEEELFEITEKYTNK